MLLKNLLLFIGLSTTSIASRDGHFQDVSVRDAEPVALTAINITTVNGLVTRDLPPIGYEYYLIGCVDEIDDGPVRVLNHQFVDWDKTGVYTCVVGCFSSGINTGPFGPHYIFAGVVNGTECWCDNTMNVLAHTVDFDTRCNHVCEDGPDEYCGGSREYQMYFLAQTGLEPFSINPTSVPSLGEGSGLYNYVGCYGDNPVNGRVLRALSYSGPEVTPAYCSELCWAYGYTYAGVEYGDECYCDSSLAYAGPIVDDTNCNQVCVADSTVTCGAPNFISIYHTDSPSRLTLTQ